MVRTSLRNKQKVPERTTRRRKKQGPGLLKQGKGGGKGRVEKLKEQEKIEKKTESEY